MANKTNITELSALLTQPYAHLELGQVDDHAVYVLLAKGRFPLHRHTMDEMYIVMEGNLTISFHNAPDLHLEKGDSTVVRAYTTHSPHSDEGAIVLMVKPKEMFARGGETE